MINTRDFPTKVRKKRRMCPVLVLSSLPLQTYSVLPDLLSLGEVTSGECMNRMPYLWPLTGFSQPGAQADRRRAWLGTIPPFSPCCSSLSGKLPLGSTDPLHNAVIGPRLHGFSLPSFPQA